MRITNNILINNMLNNIGSNMQRMDKYQQQLATGKKIQVPSDDPVVAARALKLRTDLSEVVKYKRNVQDAQSWMDLTDSTLGQIGDVLQRANELAVQSANGATTTDDLNNSIKPEVTQLKNQIINLANTTYAGRYIFSGFSTNSKLIDEATGNFNTNVNNSEQMSFQIGIGDKINVNVPGGDLFNNGNSIDIATSPKGKIIKDLEGFETAITNGDHTAISSMISNIQNDMDNVSRVRADVGARSNRLEMTSNRLDADSVNFTKLMSDNEDADQAEVIMNLTNEENVYKASLAGGARVIQPTLLDFLR
jgi:flagellar hook-associated protein 3 FlgL